MRTPDPRDVRARLALLALAAILLRLLVFLGRGDYVAFDEGWYLLLGRNLWAGEGYTLAGMRHVTLSPLFPILAGGLGRLLGDPVLAGRVVAATTAGLLVVPCFYLFRRVGGRRAAWLGCAFIGVLPSLAPFAAPRWVGWDLWVGAEPVLHLFLFTGLAFAARAFDTGSPLDWALSGAALALAYLARPEAVIVAGLLGLAALALLRIRRAPRLAAQAAAYALAFTVVAAPYWVYLHDATGRWSLSGRAVDLPVQPVEDTGEGVEIATSGAAHGIERMLWQGVHGDYARVLFALDSSGTRLASGYWGVPREDADTAGAAAAPASALRSPDDVRRPRPADRPTPADAEAQAASEPAGARPAARRGAEPTGAARAAEFAAVTRAASVAESAVTPSTATTAPSGSAREAPPAAPPPPPSRVRLYLSALGDIVPPVLWPLIVIGMLAPTRRRRRRELALFGPLVAASVLIAAVVAIDPRTQLFMVPLAAFYGARGTLALGAAFDRRTRGRILRRRFLAGALATAALAVLLMGTVQPAWLGIRLGSEHHMLAAEYRLVGEALREVEPADAPVMSWHPQVALRAGRDWRPLPMDSLGRVVRYARAAGWPLVVFGTHNPHPLPDDAMRREYMVLRLGSGAPTGQWHIQITEGHPLYAVGWLVPR